VQQRRLAAVALTVTSRLKGPWHDFPSLLLPSPISHSHPARPMSSSLDESISHLQFYDLFDAALKEYNQKTGIDIVTDPLTATLLDCDSSDEILDILQEQAHAFTHNGDGPVQLMRQLKPTVDILLGLSSSGVFGKGFGLVRLMKSICSLWMFTIALQRYLPAKMIFTGVGLLLAVCRPSSGLCCGFDNQILKAAKGVSTNYDAIIEIFECFEHFLDHLKVFTKITSAMGELLAKIMVEMLGVLALATQQINQGRFSKFVVADASHSANHDSEKFTKKLLAENDVQTMLQRLDRLTTEESRMTATQIMEVVWGLFNNMKMVMDGTEISLDLAFTVSYILFSKMDGHR
jgi:hypothetical protein